jgi:hypothetical protein
MNNGIDLSNTLVRVLTLPLIPIAFAYLELGGNWFAYRMIERQTLWSVGGTIFFSVVYSFVAAFVAKQFKIDLGLLMVNYGFGFAVVSLLIKLDWGKIPEFSGKMLQDTPALWIILLIGVLGFLASAYFVITAPPTQ